MPTFTAQSIITKAQAVLQDAGVRWLESELLDWINDGQREIASLRPDAYNALLQFQLQSGTKQTLPAAAYALLDVPRNLGANGTTPGKPVRQTKMKTLDAVEPGWHAKPQVAVVQHFMYDPRNPRVFFVYPPAAGTSYVEILVARMPAQVTDPEDVLLLGDEFANPLLDFVLCRAYSKDADFAGNADRAVMHRRSFDNSLGLKAQADASSAPNA